jgi:hypothetical protein
VVSALTGGKPQRRVWFGAALTPIVPGQKKAKAIASAFRQTVVFSLHRAFVRHRFLFLLLLFGCQFLGHSLLHLIRVNSVSLRRG